MPVCACVCMIVCVLHEYTATATRSKTQLYHGFAGTTHWTSNRQTHRHHHRWWRLLNQLRHTHTASTLAAGRHRSQRHLQPTPSHREPVSPRHVKAPSWLHHLHSGHGCTPGHSESRPILRRCRVACCCASCTSLLLLPPPRRPPPHLGIVGWCGQLAWTVTSSP